MRSLMRGVASSHAVYLLVLNLTDAFCLRSTPSGVASFGSPGRLCCVCSTNMCLPLAKYQHPRKHARCAHHAGINGDVVWLYSRREKSTWWMLDSSRRCAAEQPSMLKTQVAKLGIGNARACPDGAVAHSCCNEHEGRIPRNHRPARKDGEP